MCSHCRTTLPDERKTNLCSDCDRERRPQRFCDCGVSIAKGSPLQYCEFCVTINRKESEDRKQLRRELPERRAAAIERTQQYRIENPERVAEYNKQWRKAHPDNNRRYQKARRARKKGAAVGVVDYAAVVERQKGICATCNTLVPEGYGHFDHWVPLDRGGEHSTENTRLLCYRCNTSKGSKMPEEFNPKPVTKKKLKDQPHLLNPDWTAPGYR